MSSHFLAYMARMKLIKRWGLRWSTHEENDMEHTALVAMIAHMLYSIRKTRYGDECDEAMLLRYALYHEAAEVITGDLASPIKYFNPEIKGAFKQIERVASEKLVSYLPDDLKQGYREALFPDEQSIEWRLVKAADKISAYLKCVEELSFGNNEFEYANISLKAEIDKIKLPEVVDFVREFVPSFSLSLDVLN